MYLFSSSISRWLVPSIISYVESHGAEALWNYGAIIGPIVQRVLMSWKSSHVLVPPWAIVIVDLLVLKEGAWMGFEPRSTGPKPSGLTTWPPRLVCLQWKIESLDS